MMVQMPKRTSAILILLLLFSARPSLLQAGVVDLLNAEHLYVSGRITNTHGEGIDGAEVSVAVTENGTTSKETAMTDDSGIFEIKMLFPKGRLSGSKILLKAKKPSYAPSVRIALSPVRAEIRELGSAVFLAEANFSLRRVASPALWVSAAVLLLVYVIIAFELFHRSLAAMAGAALLLGCTYLVGPFYPKFKIITFETAARAIDMNVILLLFSMMIIVGVSERTGMFQWMAHQCYRLSGRRVWLLSAMLMTVTALTSALLDNVTTMLLIVPVTLQIAKAIKINPVSLLLPQVFASNVGGTATLIGDPPNIMIGSYTGLTFLDFTKNLGLPILAIFAVTAVFFLFYYRKDYHAAGDSDCEPIGTFTIRDRRLLVLSLIFLTMTIFLFILHGKLNMEPSIAALIGAVMLLVTSRVNLVELLETKIEWSAIIFFAALFTVIAAAQDSGLIQMIADGVKFISGDSLVIAILMVLWVSAIASAIIDNIPYTATMLPVVAYLSSTIPGAQHGILWWALAMGACLGGNGTMIGASANVVTVGLAEKAGHQITFMAYLKVCLPPMLISIGLCTIWLLFMV